MNERKNRTASFAPSEFDEQYLKWINNALKNADFKNSNEVVRSEGPLSPLLFISFVPRSGSTYLAQLLARSGGFQFVSNFIARFWMVPEVGFFLQRQIGLDGLAPKATDVASSQFGVGDHPLDPHEFGFFWRRFIPEQETDYLSKPYDEKVVADLRKSINFLRAVNKKPLFFKNCLAGYNYEFIKHCFPDAKFIVLKREEEAVISSILAARLRLYGNESIWFSLKPKDFHAIINSGLNGRGEVESQVHSISKHLDGLLDEYSNDVFEIEYESIVSAPEEIIESVVSFL
ncbi:sulfotransferase [Aestuariirhabdus sp. Z084]|uniref:sulfotransferase n=1 Tax=Aestuariirhabdus haliotis TaxID=2918751 RepID=UPI0020BDC2E7|nr:sulfotransferase [Aestuariirhabdus haliotis]MCL6415802.1 sulfotransferase [Aestuariirhabdus haliotis]